MNENSDSVLISLDELEDLVEFRARRSALMDYLNALDDIESVNIEAVCAILGIVHA